MPTPPSPSSALAAAWGPAAFSYMALAIAEIFLGSGMAAPMSYLLFGLAVTSLLCALAHKGRGFDEAPAPGAAPAFAMPWSQRTAQMAICAAFTFLSAQALGSDLLSIPLLACPATLLSAVAGWLASQSPARARG